MDVVTIKGNIGGEELQSGQKGKSTTQKMCIFNIIYPETNFYLE